MTSSDYIRWFSDLGVTDVALVGGKTVSLGELYSALAGAGVKVPPGFAITAGAYRDALTAAGAWAPLHLLDGLDKTDVDLLAERAPETLSPRATAVASDRSRRSRLIAHSLSVASVVALLASGTARAENWIVNLGAQLAVTPPYEGASRDVLEPMPTFTIRRSSVARRFTPPDDGSSLALVSTKYFDFGPVVRGREERPNTGDLKGLNRVGVAIEPGVYVDAWPASWLRGRVEVRRGILGHDGWVSDLGLDLVSTGSHWDASIGPRVGWGDRRYMQTYFGVSEAEAARSQLINTPYSAEAGQRYIGLETAVSYRISHSWRVTYDIGYHHLAAGAADSPIVRQAGDVNQYMTSLGFSYRFSLGATDR